jgi:hypothetical protein
LSHNTSSPWAERGRETNFVGKLIPASPASCYYSDGSGSLYASAQSKSNSLKILEVGDKKQYLNQDFLFVSPTLNI